MISFEDMFMGSLLGDGSLQLPERGRNSSFRILRASHDRDYLDWQFPFFKDYCGTGIVDRAYFDRRTNKEYFHSYFSTKTAKIFTDARKRWYPYGYKIVPQDLVLTPGMLAIWFLDDGCIQLVSTSKQRCKITFSTESFSVEEVKFLISLLESRYGCHFGLGNHEGKPTILASDYPARLILRDIDPIIPKGVMDRKTDVWRKNKNIDIVNIEPAFIRRQGTVEEKRKEMIECMGDCGWYNATEVAKKMNWLSVKNGKPAAGIVKIHLLKLLDAGIVRTNKRKSHFKLKRRKREK